MAVLSLNSNLASLQTQRRLGDATSALRNSLERLSSGLRVSRAVDDAAGLSIASGLNVDSRVMAQGLRNLSDGISVTNIAEGALNEITNIVTRLHELAEQAANGTLGATQRASLDAEAQALSREYLRIAKTTQFNGQKLFDGSVQGLALQAGYGSDGILNASLGGKIGTGHFAPYYDLVSFNPADVALGDLNSDGNLDIVTVQGSGSSQVFLGNGDGTFGAGRLYQTGSSESVKLGDVNNDGALDIVAANGEVTGSVSVLLGNGDGSFKTKTSYTAGSVTMSSMLGDLNLDGVLDIVAVNLNSNTFSVFLGTGNGGFLTKTDYATGVSPADGALADVNGDGKLDFLAKHLVHFGNGDGSFRSGLNLGISGQSRTMCDVNQDGILDGVVPIGTAFTIVLGNGDGSFRTGSDYSTLNSITDHVVSDMNGDGVLDLVASIASDEITLLLGNGDGTFLAGVSFATSLTPEYVATGDVNKDGVLDIIGGGEFASLMLAQTKEGIAPLLDFSLKTKADAKWTLTLMKQKLVHLTTQRGIIGANQSRFASAIANLEVERENYQAAGAQITDTDIAFESSRLLKAQILQQAGSAVLAQANASPALVLRLLQS